MSLILPTAHLSWSLTNSRHAISRTRITMSRPGLARICHKPAKLASNRRVYPPSATPTLVVVCKAVALTERVENLENGASSDASNASTNAVLNVTGMKCGGCSAAVKRILSQQPGIESAAVNLLTETAVVQLSQDALEDRDTVVEAAIEAVSSKGFPATIRRPADDVGEMADSQARAARKQEELKENTQNLALAWTLAIVCYAHHLGHLLHELGMHSYAHTALMEYIGNPIVSGVLGAAALIGPGRGLLSDGLMALTKGNPNMNSLLFLGTSTSFTAGAISALTPGLTVDPSFLEEPASVMLLATVLLGRSLEARARAQATGDLSVLANLIPSESRLVLDAGSAPGSSAESSADELMVPTSTIRPGDIMRVLPGETIPADGEVIAGSCSVDQSMLTGESKLITTVVGQSVTGGTVCYEAPITIRATSTGSASRLASIARLVEEAQAREAPVQRLADTVAGIFCFGVMTASAATFAFWSLAGAQLFPSALNVVDIADSNLEASLLLSVKLAIDVLVVACPCALGLATPTAVLVGSAAGARRGLLIRGGDVLEKLADVDTVVFDKTGTLTRGQLSVDKILPEQGYAASDILKIAASIERNTCHPLASAIVNAAAESGINTVAAEYSSTEPGNGVAGVVEGTECYVGNSSWVLQKSGVQESPDNAVPIDKGASRVWVGLKNRGIIGSIVLTDTIRPEATQLVNNLHSLGIRSILLSGDEQGVVEWMATKAGIPSESAFGEVKPEDKASFISSLRNQGLRVAMVGDGVNDSIALTAANVGIAMQSGTDAAAEASDVVLMGNSLTQVLEALTLGRKTLAKIKQNLGLALVYNCIGIPIAAGALIPSLEIALSPTMAAAMMAASSIAVVSNSIFLKYSLEENKEQVAASA